MRWKFTQKVLGMGKNAGQEGLQVRIIDGSVRSLSGFEKSYSGLRIWKMPAAATDRDIIKS